nr:MAG TPA: hypothetical protein [Caudoviricetes sp.]
MPDWYGIEAIKFEWLGQQDPLLHYKGHTFNAHDVQDSLWGFYQEDTENGFSSIEWKAFVIANAIGYLEDLINSGGEH